MQRKLVADLALAPLLTPLVNACLGAEDGEQLLKKVVEQLREAGHHPVAAGIQVGRKSNFEAVIPFSFQMKMEGVPDGLRSLAMMAQRWLTGDGL